MRIKIWWNALTEAVDFRKKLTETSVVWQFEFIALSWGETVPWVCVCSNRVVPCEEICCNSCVWLTVGAFVYHASHMACIPWDMLPSHLMCWSWNPILWITTMISKDISIYFGIGSHFCMSHETLFQLKSCHIIFNSTRSANFSVNGTGRLAKEIIFERYMPSVAW